MPVFRNGIRRAKKRTDFYLSIKAFLLYIQVRRRFCSTARWFTAGWSPAGYLCAAGYVYGSDRVLPHQRARGRVSVLRNTALHRGSELSVESWSGLTVNVDASFSLSSSSLFCSLCFSRMQVGDPRSSPGGLPQSRMLFRASLHHDADIPGGILHQCCPVILLLAVRLGSSSVREEERILRVILVCGALLRSRRSGFQGSRLRVEAHAGQSHEHLHFALPCSPSPDRLHCSAGRFATK